MKKEVGLESDSPFYLFKDLKAIIYKRFILLQSQLLSKSWQFFYFTKKEEIILANIRVQLKHDLEINWKKAINFVPKPGEMIIYEAETVAPTAEEAIVLERNYAIPYVRIKIGDKIGTLLNNLPFETFSQVQIITWEEND